MRVEVAPGDLTWLHMDRPNNLMYVHGVLMLDERPDWDAVEEVLATRLVGRFPVFRRRAVKVGGSWMWEDDPTFSLANHVRRVTLDGATTQQDVERYISSRFSEPFDEHRPLWQMDLVEGVPGPDGGTDAALVLARFHHAIADGIRLVQVLLSLLDPASDDAMPARVGRASGGSGRLGGTTRLARHLAAGTADFAVEIGATVTRSPSWVTRLHPRNLADTVGALGDPVRMLDSVTGVASEGNKLANTWRSVGRLAMAGRPATQVLNGTPGVEKRVSWISGLPLDTIRAVGKAHDVTINDVLLSAVSLGLTDYLSAQGEQDVEHVNWLIPVSLAPIDATPSEDLGNHFALVLMPMPLGMTDTHRLLREVRTRMTRIKNSAEPAVVYGVQRTIAETPSSISVPLTNFVANKALGILTNVPGPRAPMMLAGTEVSRVLGWVPTSGDQPLGLCIFSYNGSVSVGIAADAGLVPDPELLAQCIERAVYRLAADG